MAEAASPSSHSSFCEEVFSRTAHAGTNEVDRTNILAPGFWSGTCRTHLLPAFTASAGAQASCLWGPPQQVTNLLATQTWKSMPRTKRLAHREVVSSYSSATAPDLHGISCADPLFQARKELPPEVAACAWRFKIYLINAQQISCALD
jgi:hypothetical protein